MQLKLVDLVPSWIYQSCPLSKADHANFFNSNQTRPPMHLRIQGDKQKVISAFQGKANLEQSEYLKSSLTVRNARINLNELEPFKKGAFEVQDLASQAIGIATAAKPGERWWDACCGAGGKTMQLASMMKNKGAITATDIREWKLDDLKKRAKRGGFHNINAKGWDGIHAPSKTDFDGVLVDAPCSCTGTWRRNPDARWTSTGKDIREMAEIQHKLLRTCAKAVKPGGYLIYATCSISSEENEEMIISFITDHPEFKLEAIPHPLSGEPTNGMIRIWSWEFDCDSMFVARLQRG